MSSGIRKAGALSRWTLNTRPDKRGVGGVWVQQEIEAVTTGEMWRGAIGDRPRGREKKTIKNTFGTGGEGRYKISINIRYRDQVLTCHCPKLELHQLIIWTHRLGL